MEVDKLSTDVAFETDESSLKEAIDLDTEATFPTSLEGEKRCDLNVEEESSEIMDSVEALTCEEESSVIDLESEATATSMEGEERCTLEVEDESSEIMDSVERSSKEALTSEEESSVIDSTTSLEDEKRCTLEGEEENSVIDLESEATTTTSPEGEERCTLEVEEEGFKIMDSEESSLKEAIDLDTEATTKGDEMCTVEVEEESSEIMDSEESSLKEAIDLESKATTKGDERCTVEGEEESSEIMDSEESSLEEVIDLECEATTTSFELEDTGEEEERSLKLDDEESEVNCMLCNDEVSSEIMDSDISLEALSGEEGNCLKEAIDLESEATTSLEGKDEEERRLKFDDEAMYPPLVKQTDDVTKLDNDDSTVEALTKISYKNIVLKRPINHVLVKAPPPKVKSQKAPPMVNEETLKAPVVNEETLKALVVNEQVIQKDEQVIVVNFEKEAIDDEWATIKYRSYKHKEKTYIDHVPVTITNIVQLKEDSVDKKKKKKKKKNKKKNLIEVEDVEEEETLKLYTRDVSTQKEEENEKNRIALEEEVDAQVNKIEEKCEEAPKRKKQKKVKLLQKRKKATNYLWLLAAPVLCFLLLILVAVGYVL